LEIHQIGYFAASKQQQYDDDDNDPVPSIVRSSGETEGEPTVHPIAGTTGARGILFDRLPLIVERHPIEVTA